jgi:hypothetical protein
MWGVLSSFTMSHLESNYVDHFDPQYIELVKVKVKFTLRLAVYRQSVRLSIKPLETHDKRFLFQLNSCDNSPYVTSLLRRRWVCLL